MGACASGCVCGISWAVSNGEASVWDRRRCGLCMKSPLADAVRSTSVNVRCDRANSVGLEIFNFSACFRSGGGSSCAYEEDAHLDICLWSRCVVRFGSIIESGELGSTLSLLCRLNLDTSLGSGRREDLRLCCASSESPESRNVDERVSGAGLRVGGPTIPRVNVYRMCGLKVNTLKTCFSSRIAAIIA